MKSDDARSSRKLPMNTGKALLVFALMIPAGLAGFFLLRGSLAGYLFAHLGALGLMGLFGLAAVKLAVRKGYGSRLAFALAGAMPVALGVITVILLYFMREPGVFYCGGSVTLGAGILVLAGYLIASISGVKRGQTT